MKLAGPTLIFLHLCLAAALITLLVFSLSLSISQHHSVLFSAFALILKVKSSPIFGFCICNLIIVAISLGSSSRASDGEFDYWFVPLPSIAHQREEERQDVDDDDRDSFDENYSDDDDNGNGDALDGYENCKDDIHDCSDDEDDDFHGYDGYDEDNDDDLNEEDDEDSEAGSCDEFIARINKEWRAEWVREKLLLGIGVQSKDMGTH